MVKICKKGADIRLETQASLWWSHWSHDDIRSKPHENLRHGKQQVQQRSWGWGSKLSICKVQKEVYFRVWLITPVWELYWDHMIIWIEKVFVNCFRCCWRLCIICFRTSGDTEQATGSASDRYGREKRCSEGGFDVSESRQYWREGMLSLRATCSLPFFFHRKTRRANVAVSAARTEPVPGARGAGAPGCPSIWEVSGGGAKKVGR